MVVGELTSHSDENLFFVCALLPGGIYESNVFILQQTEFFYDLLFVRSVLFCFLYFSRDFRTSYDLLSQFDEENGVRTLRTQDTLDLRQFGTGVGHFGPFIKC